jgi:hypothetical protein
VKRSDVLGALVAIVPLAAARAAGAAETSAGSVTDVIARELAAFNSHDAAGIAALHAPDAAITILPANAVIAKGSAAITGFFTKDFADNPKASLTLEKQFVLKNVVVSHYTTATGSPLMAIYEVAGGVIANEWIVVG